ncbi:MAG TPA: CPBP family intramembrane glutamic endopeptidase [Terriglobia bacterium]|nr:CPBP family intramembrane glutamic endopeptidase [Terriglobia bacterium]
MDDHPQSAVNSVGEAPRDREAQLPLWPSEGGANPAVPDAAVSGEATAEDSRPGPVAGTAPESLAAPAEPPWKFSDLGLFLLFAVMALLVANSVATGLYLVLAGRLGGNVRLDAVQSQAPYLVLMQVIWESLWFLFIYYTITAKYRRGFWEAIRWVSPQRGSKTFLLAGIGLAVAIQAIFSFFPSEEPLPIERLFSSPEAGYLLAFFGIAVAPFMEELVFRGFFYPVFERRWGITAAVALTALLFALIHAPQLSGSYAEMTAIFLVGLALSYTRGRTRSLVPSYLMHLGYNASLFVSLYLATDRFRALQG